MSHSIAYPHTYVLDSEAISEKEGGDPSGLAMAAGASAFISKPFTSDLLKEKIYKVLRIVAK